VLHVHTYAGPEPTDIARVEGHGPVTERWVREHLGPTARFVVKPVLDPAGLAPVDAYEIPDRHRQAVHLMTPADTFPWGVSTLAPSRSTTPSPTSGEGREVSRGWATTDR
jgi:hypothetical protein